MSDRTWHKGPPPFVGWWNASFTRNPNVWRWWNGKVWSQPAHRNDSEKTAARMANSVDRNLHHEWTDYYPPNARVPRVAP